MHLALLWFKKRQGSMLEERSFSGFSDPSEFFDRFRFKIVDIWKYFLRSPAVADARVFEPAGRLEE